MSNPTIKASVLIPQLHRMVGAGYVYGMRWKDSPCTVSILKSKEKQYGTKMGAGYYQKNGDYTRGKCARWLGKPATDCSGMIRGAYWEILNHKYDFSKSASGMYQWCKRRGSISTMPKQAGVLVFKTSSGASLPHHVGVYVGNGMVIEDAGVSTGIRLIAFNSGWTHWGIWDILEMDIPVDGKSMVPAPAEPEDPDNPIETVPVLFTTTPTLYHLWNVGKAFDIPWTAIRKEDGSVPNPLGMRAGITLIVGWKLVEKPVFFTTTKDLYLLGAIGARYGVDWRTIRNADGSTPNPKAIRIGQVLRIK